MTARREKPTSREGDWVTIPNIITVTRLVLLLPLGVCLLNVGVSESWRRGAFLLFAAMALSDALDGWLARILRQQSLLGRLLDPLADKFVIIMSLVILALAVPPTTGVIVPVWVAAVAFAKEVITVAGLMALWARAGHFKFAPRLLGKACTLVEFLLILAALMAPEYAWLEQGLPVLWWAVVGLAAAATIDYVQYGWRMSRPRDVQLPEETQ